MVDTELVPLRVVPLPGTHPPAREFAFARPLYPLWNWK